MGPQRRDHLTPIRMATVKTERLSAAEDAEMENGVAAVETVWRVLRKLPGGSSHEPAAPLLRMRTKEVNAGVEKSSPQDRGAARVPGRRSGDAPVVQPHIGL